VFTNAPAMVENRIRSFPINLKSYGLRYYSAAFGLIPYYISQPGIIFDNDDFFGFEKPFPNGTNWEYIARVTQFAAMLFQLRNEPGFGEICRRLATRNLKQAHSELSAAAILFQHDLVVDARPEIGVAKRDFDFSVSKLGNSINVEVWMSERKQFDEQVLLSRLNDKRKQLPADAPAVLMCIFPEHWHNQVEGLNFRFDHVTEKFFRGTSRINFVVYVHEEVWDDEATGGGYLTTNAYAIPHPNPRHPNSYLIETLLKGPNAHNEIEQFIASPKTVNTRQSHDEFHRWVNWLIDGAI
jgi:hypothetical protein